MRDLIVNSAKLMGIVPVVLAGCWRGDATPPGTPSVGEAPAERATEPATHEWRRACGDDATGWETVIEMRLRFRDEGALLVAVGSFDFERRNATIELRGPRTGPPPYELHGVLDEVYGDTTWNVKLVVTPGSQTLRGQFFELLDGGGEDLICTFAWTR
ncbi:MAG: hypothetical protein NT062_27035 [Proteobacteria bacterium]|nr:hypothetical protein [Pseudomonadota bacterium]